MSEVRRHLEANGQGHVFAFYESLSDDEKASLDEQAAAIDLDEIAELTVTLIQSNNHESAKISDGIEPANYIPLPNKEGGDPARWIEAQAKGEAALRAGRVAAFTVAGGQGTRLGYDGPKGPSA